MEDARFYGRQLAWRVAQLLWWAGANGILRGAARLDKLGERARMARDTYPSRRFHMPVNVVIREPNGREYMRLTFGPDERRAARRFIRRWRQAVRLPRFAGWRVES